MTSRSRIAGVAAALAAGALLAGCGGSSGPSKAEFVKKADALCVQTNKAHPPPPQAKSPQEAAAQQASEVAIRRDLDKKLKALDVPSSLKKDFQAYNAGTTKIIAAIDKTRVDAEQKNEKQYNADLKVFEQAATERENSAVKLGFKTCGRQHPAGATRSG
jgi:hypothetical protein